jgi:molybdopterin synthase sulfur carrier subunit
VEEVALPAEVGDVSGLVAWLSARGGAWTRALGDPRLLKITVNRQFVDADARLTDGSEVALVGFVDS